MPLRRQSARVAKVPGVTPEQVLDRFRSLRQHQQSGRRSPHKPLLVLLALGQVARNGSSALAWQEAQPALADLVAEFGPVSKTPRAQSAAYPFTRLRSDGVWLLDTDVPMDNVGPLSGAAAAYTSLSEAEAELGGLGKEPGVTGRLDPQLEAALSADTCSALPARA